MTPITLGTIQAVLCGQAQPFARPDGRSMERSAIDKRPVSGAVAVQELGLAGDEQGDLRVHGGPDKAVHQYALEHYPAWRAQLGALPVLAAPGAFGENLASTGVTEADLCWGDILRIGTVVLQVSQTRQPCWKLNQRFGHVQMARSVQDSGRTGWYYRVLETGQLQAGDAMLLVQRPHPQWPLSRVLELLYRRAADVELLRSFAQLRLPPSWQRLVQARLDSGELEDWQRRLQGE